MSQTSSLADKSLMDQARLAAVRTYPTSLTLTEIETLTGRSIDGIRARIKKSDYGLSLVAISAVGAPVALARTFSHDEVSPPNGRAVQRHQPEFWIERRNHCLKIVEPKRYPSDVTDDKWGFIAPDLTLMKEAPQREHGLREVFNGLRWMVRAGRPDG